MTLLDDLIATPRLLEVEEVEVQGPALQVWEAVRHGNLARSALVRALFWLRTLPSRMEREEEVAPHELRIDDLRSIPEHPGFSVLADDPPRSFAVGAIGKVWQGDIPFVYVADAAAFAAFQEPDYVKVAWAVRVVGESKVVSRVEFELRVSATDEEAWRKFRQYFRWIGPASRFIRRAVLDQLARDFDTSVAGDSRPLTGDELLPDARGQITHDRIIAASAEEIWPWLVQMGFHRAGYYSIDLFDHQGQPSARELHPEWQDVEVGQVIPATAEGDVGFEVLHVEPARALVLGGLFDPHGGGQRPFWTPRPAAYWQVTWAFVLEPLAEGRTRLHVRARAAFSPEERLHAAWIRPVHHLMQASQLRNLAARIEGRPSDQRLR